MSRLKLIDLLKNTIVEQGPLGLWNRSETGDITPQKSTGVSTVTGKVVGVKQPLGDSTIYNTSCDAPLYDQIVAILHQEEGFTERPRWDVDNYRIGYGSMTTTYPDGSYEYLPSKRPNGHEGEEKCIHPEGKNKKGIKWIDYKITREDADRDFERIINDVFVAKLKEKLGPDLFNETPPCVIAPIISVMYNYGPNSSEYNSVINATKNKDYCMVASEISNLTSNPNRRQKEGQWVKECICQTNNSDLTSN
jgi:GH24 family phage-related lysozyme (muramidase)